MSQKNYLDTFLFQALFTSLLKWTTLHISLPTFTLFLFLSTSISSFADAEQEQLSYLLEQWLKNISYLSLFVLIVVKTILQSTLITTRSLYYHCIEFFGNNKPDKSKISLNYLNKKWTIPSKIQHEHKTIFFIYLIKIICEK
jgi:hypothetical protein